MAKELIPRDPHGKWRRALELTETENSLGPAGAMKAVAASLEKDAQYLHSKGRPDLAREVEQGAKEARKKYDLMLLEGYVEYDNPSPQ